MTDERLQKLKVLKEKFRSLNSKEREHVGICFLKVKLGVHGASEMAMVRGFLGALNINLEPDNLDQFITYLHSEEGTLPEFIAMEESLTQIEKSLADVTAKTQMPGYEEDSIETLREAQKPFLK
jgi:hypothetical protein